ncbi:MAG: hypothetical protein JJE52_13625 [Acidimicrobiia bacterium]|nr:hypothetical protein [Acidimicrobiia bacterium]
MRHLRCRHLLFIASLGALLVASACTGDPPAAQAGESSVEGLAAAASRTAQADTGRFVVAIDIGATGVPGAQLLHTTVSGAYDHARGAVDATVDVDAVVASVPVVVDGIPPELLGDTIQVRAIGRKGWVRTRSDGPWSPVPAAEADVAAIEGIYGPDELLGLLDHATGEVTTTDGGELGGLRYSGHIDIAAVAADDGALGRATTALPPELAQRFLRYDAWVGDDGVVQRLVVELDVAGMAEAVGEVAPEGVVFRYTVDWTDLGASVDIAPPELVADQDPSVAQ